DGPPRTSDLGGGLGPYRLAAITAPGDSVVVIGLSRRDVEATVRGLAGVVVVVALLGLATAGLVGGRVLRTALRPLDEVVDTASRVAELPLDRGDVALSVRVPTDEVDAGTEVGRVAGAMNRML